MAASFEFSKEDMDKHLCRTWQEGDWIIMQCLKCSFLRRMNWKTGELYLDHPGRKEALHTAQYQAEAINIRSESMN